MLIPLHVNIPKKVIVLWSLSYVYGLIYHVIPLQPLLMTLIVIQKDLFVKWQLQIKVIIFVFPKIVLNILELLQQHSPSVKNMIIHVSIIEVILDVFLCNNIVIRLVIKHVYIQKKKVFVDIMVQIVYLLQQTMLDIVIYL